MKSKLSLSCNCSRVSSLYFLYNVYCTPVSWMGQSILHRNVGELTKPQIFVLLSWFFCPNNYIASLVTNWETLHRGIDNGAQTIHCPRCGGRPFTPPYSLKQNLSKSADCHLVRSALLDGRRRGYRCVSGSVAF